MSGTLFRRLLLSSSRLERLAFRPARNAVTSSTGGVLGQPFRGSYGVIKVGIFSTPFIYLGAYMGKFFAEKMEELDVFVPDDDDDDD